jgi:hypothetical protein
MVRLAGKEAMAPALIAITPAGNSFPPDNGDTE